MVAEVHPARVVSLTAADLAAVPDEVVARIASARNVMTVCHRDPEPDALGSALGLALALEALGKRATPVCADPVPDASRFLPEVSRFRQAPDPDLDYDLIVVGDCGELERVGSVLQEHAELFSRVPIVDIDHHKSNVGFGSLDWIDPDASATCEMVTLLLPRLGVPLDAAGGAIAANLMAGVVIDTANFQHPNTTARTLRVASELRAAGAPLYDIARRLYRTKPNAQLHLFGLVLARLETAWTGGCCGPSCSRRLRGGRRHAADVRGPDRPAGAVRDRRGRDHLQGQGRPRRGSACAPRTAASMRPCSPARSVGEGTPGPPAPPCRCRWRRRGRWCLPRPSASSAN